MKKKTFKEVAKAQEEIREKIWYNRHLILKEKVEEGKEKVDPEIWKNALLAEERILKEFGGEENILPADDFEWGMLNGKLSALRWVMGDEWDDLDT